MLASVLVCKSWDAVGGNAQKGYALWHGPITSIEDVAPTNGTLLVFMDDTGKEDLNPIHQPVYGFGGVIVTWAEYERVLRSPWNAMRAAIGLQHGDKFHATSLPHGDIAAVQEVFKANRFARFAGIMTDKTEWPKLIASAAAWMDKIVQRRVQDIAKWSDFTNIALIIEDAEANRDDIKRLFGEWRFMENGLDLPIQVATMTKKPCEAGLEAADYVANRAAKEVKLRLRGEPLPHPESPAIFHTSDPRLASFMMVESIRQD